MNKIFKLFSILSLVTIVFFACTPDEYQLKAPLDKSAVKFSVTVDATNPNKFILKSETPNAQPYWVTPVGTSVKLNDTIVIPFPGKDTIMYSVETPGGIVTAEPYAFEVTTIDAAYVSGQMWTDLTGGINKSKTWVLDLDANGVSKYFLGPFYYGGIDAKTGPWEWDPKFSDIGWAGVSKGDYGTMTFDLIGNANFKSDNKMFPDLSGTGKFMLFPGTKQIITYGAQFLHDKAQGGNVLNWNAKMTINALDADHMQVIAISGTNAWYLYNYISKDYYDSH
ncbi:MAG: hypothetical protein PHS84_13525 [Paludibacter sp.]|nr:hypothetical protein [Paludibacter sp.]